MEDFIIVRKYQVRDFFIGFFIQLFLLFICFFDFDPNETTLILSILLFVVLLLIFAFTKKKYIILGMVIPILIFLLVFGSCLLII